VLRYRFFPLFVIRRPFATFRVFPNEKRKTYKKKPHH